MQEQNTRFWKGSSFTGISCGVLAYLIWGLSPVYWKELQMVPALEIICHRIVWSFFLLVALVIIAKQWREFVNVFKRPSLILIMLGTSSIISLNWFIYIWAVNNGYILQASLGYYINPLVNVLLGMLFLKERLRRLQIVAVFMAFTGVLVLTIFFGSFPWVSLTLAFSFGFYALIRKTAAISSLVGLTAETLMLSIPASIFLIFRFSNQAGAFASHGLYIDLLLIGASLVTALPLLLFNLAGKRLMLATLGFLQYLAPTCMFLIGVLLWDEEVASAQLIAFICIWSGLVVYSLDSLVVFKKLHER